MFFSHKYNSKDFFKKSTDDYNIYIICNGENIEKIKKILNNNLVVEKDFTKIINMTQHELATIDLLIYISNDDYNISIGEKIRVLTKKISLLSKKNITSAYIYNNKHSYVKLYFESNGFTQSKIIPLDNENLISNLDLISLKHSEFDDLNSSKKYIK